MSPISSSCSGTNTTNIKILVVLITTNGWILKYETRNGCKILSISNVSGSASQKASLLHDICIPLWLGIHWGIHFKEFLVNRPVGEFFSHGYTWWILTLIIHMWFLRIFFRFRIAIRCDTGRFVCLKGDIVYSQENKYILPFHAFW